MKIGIMTFWESNNNYGQLLQLYALQTYLKERGHEPFLIQFRRIIPPKKKTLKYKISRFYPLNIIEYLIFKKKTRKIAFYDKKREFVKFKNKHIISGDIVYESFQALKENPPNADVYICGSDQIWNNSWGVSAEPYLLGFGNANVKRIAYAASFGQRSLSDDTYQLFKKYIDMFDGVCVREESGLTICKSLGYQYAKWLPDPTLLFDRKKWIALLSLNPTRSNKSKQIFIYTLGNSKIGDKQKFIDYAKSLKDTDVFHASANNDFSGNTYPSIYKWLEIISGSDLIITTSFHGMVFSIIFNRNFIVLPNTGKSEGMNERIESLLGKLDLKDHILQDFDEQRVRELSIKSVDWTSINEKLAEWAQESANFFHANNL